MRRKDFDRDALHFAPFLLLPSPFPRREFHRAVDVQTVLGELMHRVAHDREFLQSALAATVKVDDFTGRLFRIYTTVWDEGLAQVAPNELFLAFRHSCITLNLRMGDKAKKIASRLKKSQSRLRYAKCDIYRISQLSIVLRTSVVLRSPLPH